MRYKYTKKATITLKDAKLKLEGVWQGRTDYADLITTSSPKKTYSVKMQYVVKERYGNELCIDDHEDSASLTLYSFVTLHNRRIIIQKQDGYAKYHKLL